MSDDAGILALKSQIDRMESMLLHLYLLHYGNYLNWQNQEYTFNDAFDDVSSAALDPLALSHQEHSSRKATVTSSKLRRSRAKEVRKRLWQEAKFNKAHGEGSANGPAEVEHPIDVDDADMSTPLFSKLQVQSIIDRTRAGCEEVLGARVEQERLKLAEDKQYVESLIAKTATEVAVLKEESTKIEQERLKLSEEWRKVNEVRRDCLIHSDLVEGKRIITNDLRDPKRNHVLGVLIRYDGEAAR